MLHRLGGSPAGGKEFVVEGFVVLTTVRVLCWVVFIPRCTWYISYRTTISEDDQITAVFDTSLYGEMALCIVQRARLTKGSLC